MLIGHSSNRARAPDGREMPDERRRAPGAGPERRAPALTVLAALALGVGAAPPGGAGARPAAAPGGPATSRAAVSAGALPSYALAAPDILVALPPRLAEVSGVTALSDTQVACVQDEEGMVFVYDLTKRQVTRLIRFGPPGDYEDLAGVDGRLFVLRSDGVLFEIQGLSGTPRSVAHVLRLPASDYEGLCYDARHRRLLIAAKSSLGAARVLKDTRAVFAFGLARTALQPSPVLVLEVATIREFAERQGRQAPDGQRKAGAKPEPALRFMPSALAIHPATSEIFVLSAVDRVLVTFDANGEVTGYASLDPARFRQPEGIAFLANGDLVITNEAAGRQPTLLLFKRRAAGSAS